MLGASSAFWRLGAWKHNREVEPLETIEKPDLGLAIVDGTKGPRLIAYGEPKAAIAALTDFAGRGLVPHTTMINREVYGALDEATRTHFGPYWGHAWDFFWTDAPLAEIEHCERVEFLRAHSAKLEPVRDEVRAALLASNPISAAVDEFDHLDWFILRAPDGNIATVMGAERSGTGMGFHGLGTVPAYRGKGYGGATMVGAVNASLQLASHIQFGVWGWNDGAMRLYSRLGIRHDGGLIFGSDQPFKELQAT